MRCREGECLEASPKEQGLGPPGGGSVDVGVRVMGWLLCEKVV